MGDSKNLKSHALPTPRLATHFVEQARLCKTHMFLGPDQEPSFVEISPNSVEAHVLSITAQLRSTSFALARTLGERRCRREERVTKGQTISRGQGRGLGRSEGSGNNGV